MEVAKTNRENKGEAREKRGKPLEDGLKRAPPPMPADEEVEEFFAVVKRIQVAVKYFQRRDGIRRVDCEMTSKSSWRPSFQREDFDVVKTDPECSRGCDKKGLDLNSDPDSDV